MSDAVPLKRQRTAVDPLHPLLRPEDVVPELLELPKLVVVQMMLMLESREIAALDTTCFTFHPFHKTKPQNKKEEEDQKGLTQLAAEIYARRMLLPRWQTKSWPRCIADARRRESVASAGRMSSAHFGHSLGVLVVSKDDAVMSCGYQFQDVLFEQSCAFLGHGTEGNERSPKAIEALKDKKVVQVSSGANFGLVLAESGDVFSFGVGEEGQLGHGDTEIRTLPKLVEALKGTKVVQVSAGMFHSLVLTESGDVLSFGEDETARTPFFGAGRLGHGDDGHTHHLVPKPVEALKSETVVQVSAGSRHSLALTKSGDVFFFGATDFGFHPGSGERLPKLIEALQGKKVVQISAGEYHSLVLTEGGDVFSFGHGSQLGHGDVESQDQPKLVEALAGKDVVQVSAGTNHSLVVTESGDVFSFGNGRNGELGHGDTETQNLPKLVKALKDEKVVEVHAGNQLSLVRTNDSVFACGLTFEELDPHPNNMWNKRVVGGRRVGRLSSMDLNEMDPVGHLIPTNYLEPHRIMRL